MHTRAIDAAFAESSLFGELTEAFEADDYERFESEAKRQHFVPRFLLARFAMKSGKRELVHQLDVRTGKAWQVETKKAASSRYFYAILGEDGARNNRVEGFLGRVESHASEALRRFLADPAALAPGDRATLAFFFALQDARTPAATERAAAASDTIGRLLLANEFSDVAAFRRTYRELFGDASDDDIEVFRQDVLRRLHDGSVGFADERAQALDAGLGVAAQLAYVIFEMDWRLLLKKGAFVASDRGLAMYDPEPRFPFSAQSWRSSPAAETTIPLSSDAVLLIRPLSFGIDTQEVDEDGARCLNLRTYGWASGYIYGQTEELVESVRQAAADYPNEVGRPRPRSQLMLFEADPDDPTFADANEKEGWPRYIVEDGVEYDYVVIPHGAESLELAAEVNRKVEERARRKLGTPEGEPTPGRAVIDPVDPESLR